MEWSYLARVRKKKREKSGMVLPCKSEKEKREGERKEWNGLTLGFATQQSLMSLANDRGQEDRTMSLSPLQSGKILVWDATCSDSLAPSLRDVAIWEPGAVAAGAKHHKRSKKYSHLNVTYHFVPIAVETLGVGEAARSFFWDLAKRLKAVNEDLRSHQFLLQ